jgi:hypothetical protein
MAVIGIAVQGGGVQHELAALRPGQRGADTDLAAELVGLGRLAPGSSLGRALADALDLGRVQAVELPAALALRAHLTVKLRRQLRNPGK